VVSLLREPAINRDSLVDFALLGPLIALLISLVLYIAGDFVWVQSAITLQAAQSTNSIIGIQAINPSLMQAGIDSLVSPLVRSVPAGYARLSPLLDAGTVGFFMTFLNLLPITHFDGGNAFANAFGGRGLRLTTVVCAVALAVIDTPNYLFLGLFVLLIAGRQTDVQCLDEISPASASRKAFFFIALVLALLCLPFPQKILTLTI
jgi:membrane-associated protease RseP (regulator of RpoE activity)